MKLVLKHDTDKFDSQFHAACDKAGVRAYLSGDAAQGFPEYLVYGDDPKAVDKIIAEFGIPIKPRYTHDCTGCTFLGHFNADGTDFDLYHCIQGGPLDGIPTVIARYGNDGPRYLSGIGMTATAPLQEAEKRANEKGLPTKFPQSPQKATKRKKD